MTLEWSWSEGVFLSGLKQPVSPYLGQEDRHAPVTRPKEVRLRLLSSPGPTSSSSQSRKAPCRGVGAGFDVAPPGPSRDTETRVISEDGGSRDRRRGVDRERPMHAPVSLKCLSIR